MSAARISTAVVRRIAEGVAGTNTFAVIEDVERGLRVIIASPGTIALPWSVGQKNEAEQSCDEAFGLPR
jgi:hypothetical protein